MTQEQITDTNCIICGDCRDQLARIPDGSVDLIYLDPPFFSGKNYEIIWKDGSEIRSFTDTEFYTLICECGKVFPDKNKFCADCGAPRDKATEHKSKNIQAYLQWLRPRLERCREVLKDTGSIYLHLDWHAVHYVKVMMDEIFGYNNFKNDITWCYTGPSNTKKWFPRKHDTILFYTKSNKWTFNPDNIKVPYKAINSQKGNGIIWGKNGMTQDEIEVQLNKGKIPEDWWDNMSPVGRIKNERLGYPTQKPESLLERIIRASSNPGDVILDPFCGCGTAVAVAQKLGRRWIGIDVSPTSCKLMVKRLRDIKGDWIRITEADIIDLPRTCAELRKMEPFEFQNLVVAKFGGKQNTKKTDDEGIDGWTYKKDEKYGFGYKTGGSDKSIQVKRSEVGRPDVNKFSGAMDTDKETDGKRGIIVGFKFSTKAEKYVRDLKTRTGKSIELITVKELFDC